MEITVTDMNMAIGFSRKGFELTRAQLIFVSGVIDIVEVPFRVGGCNLYFFSAFFLIVPHANANENSP